MDKAMQHRGAYSSRPPVGAVRVYPFEELQMPFRICSGTWKFLRGKLGLV